MIRLRPILFVLIVAASIPGSVFAQDFDFFEPTTTVAGYGELHYNTYSIERDIWKKQLDFHRFVVFLGHSWSERWSFRAEVELEHNFVKDGQGELELEQAFVNYHRASYLGFQAGVILISAGLINEYHEPPRFFGVERPEYNKLIIPTTWFGNGAAAYGLVEGFEYRVSIMEGLNADGFSAKSGIRDGREKGFKVDADNLLYNGRVDFVGLPGLRIGTSYIYNNAKGDSITNEINLVEIHAQYQAHNVYALLEAGNISYGSGEIETSRGYYFDLGYNIGSLFNIDSKIVSYIRYSNINTAAKTKTGGDSEKKYHYTQWMVGINFLPIDQVVFKVDYGEKQAELEAITSKMFNLGVGYMF
jgi:hypothetical protein